LCGFLDKDSVDFVKQSWKSCLAQQTKSYSRLLSACVALDASIWESSVDSLSSQAFTFNSVDNCISNGILWQITHFYNSFSQSDYSEISVIAKSAHDCWGGQCKYSNTIQC